MWMSGTAREHVLGESSGAGGQDVGSHHARRHDDDRAVVCIGKVARVDDGMRVGGRGRFGGVLGRRFGQRWIGNAAHQEEIDHMDQISVFTCEKKQGGRRRIVLYRGMQWRPEVVKTIVSAARRSLGSEARLPTTRLRVSSNCSTFPCKALINCCFFSRNGSDIFTSRTEFRRSRGDIRHFGRSQHQHRTHRLLR